MDMYPNRILHMYQMQIKKSLHEGKQITRFTEVQALSIDQRVGISQSASETDVCLFFLKIIIYHSQFLLFLTFYDA